MQIAAVGNRCKHMQCYDLKSYIHTVRHQKNLEKRWRCPECDQVVLPEDLTLDHVVQSILDRPWVARQELVILENGERLRRFKKIRDENTLQFDKDAKWTVLGAARAQCISSSSSSSSSSDVEVTEPSP